MPQPRLARDKVGLRFIKLMSVGFEVLILGGICENAGHHHLWRDAADEVELFAGNNLPSPANNLLHLKTSYFIRYDVG